MSEKVDGNRLMSRVIDWKYEVEAIAGPFTGNRKGWFAKAARRAGITCRQVKALWRGETKDPKFTVAVGVLSAAIAARKEARELASKFENLAGALNAKDEDFYSSDVLALIDAARRLRGLDRPGN